MKNVLSKLINFMFPDLCVACGDHLLESEIYVCEQCLYDLPKTNYCYDPENEVAKIFWGRIPLEQAAALYFFQKGGKLQQIIHHLKYKNAKEIGYVLGREAGLELVNLPSYMTVDCVVPVPLHKKKINIRGYNQSEWIAKGMADIMKKELLVNALVKKIPSKSQTRKNRIERIKNVEYVFELAKPEQIQNKHILLIDDVLTTGATLEACTLELLKATNTRVSIITLAFAKL